MRNFDLEGEVIFDRAGAEQDMKLEILSPIKWSIEEWADVIIAILKSYCAKKDIRNDVLHQFDLVANAIPGVEELTGITQRNLKTAIALKRLTEQAVATNKN